MSEDADFQRDNSLWQQCRRLLGGADPPAPETWPRRLRDAADLEAQIADPRLRGEAGLLRGRRALAEGIFDHAVEALATAKAAYTQQGRVPRKVADCCTQLASAYAARQQPREAIAALREARDAYRDWGADESIDYQVTVAVSLARRLLAIGDAETALTELDTAVTELDSTLGGEDLHRSHLARLTAVRAVALAAQGRYEHAEQVMIRLGRVGEPRLDADLDDAYGFVYASSGRADRAAQRYRAAVDAYKALVDAVTQSSASAGPALADREELAGLRTALGTCTMNLGAALGAEGKHPEAIERYRSALALFEQIPSAADKVVECRLNIGAEALAAKDYDRAAESLLAVDDLLSSTTEFARLRAGCAMNLGRLLDINGQHSDAARRHRTARKEFLDAGMPEWAARAGLNLAVSLTHAVTADETSDDPIEELIPALLFLDHMRFQFPTVAARAAWRNTVTGAYQLAFDLAAADPQLTSELIENAINSGSHSATPVVAQDDSALGLQTGLGALGDPSPLSAAPTVGGGGSLITGAVLPMRPPPRVLMPNGMIALRRFHSAAAIYGEMPYSSDDVVAVGPAADPNVTP